MKPILLLHGAIGAKDQLQPLASLLKKDHEVFCLDFSGHGESNKTPDTFSIELFAQDVINFMDSKNLNTVDIIGYSMGGYVAMYLAKYFEKYVNKIVTLATKFHWDEAIAAKEIKLLDAEKIAIKLPAFAASLRKRHQAHDWEKVLAKTAGMLSDMGKENPLKISDYSTITHSCLIAIGDNDKMVTLNETVEINHLLPNAQMAMLPNTQHPLEQTNLEVFAMVCIQFLKS